MQSAVIVRQDETRTILDGGNRFEINAIFRSAARPQLPGRNTPVTQCWVMGKRQRKPRAAEMLGTLTTALHSIPGGAATPNVLLVPQRPFAK